MNTYKCADCGTPLIAATGFGLHPKDASDGRAHTPDVCVEYIKAALRASRKEVLKLQVLLERCAYCMESDWELHDEIDCAPTRSVFKSLAEEMGIPKEMFGAWAKDKEWKKK